MLSRSDEFDQVVGIYVDSVDLSSSVDRDHSIGASVSGGDERKLISDSLSIDESTSADFEHEEVSEFSHEEDNSVFRTGLHEDGEVTLSIGSHSNININAVFSLTRSRGTDVHDEELIVLLFRLSLSKADQTVFVGGDISDRHLSETSGIGV